MTTVPPLIGYRLNRWSSIVTVSADGQHVREREVLWESWANPGHRRGGIKLTSSIRGKRAGDVATTAADGQGTGDTAD